MQSLPFEKVQRKVTTLDVQPLSRAGNIIVYVTGLLIVGDPGLLLMQGRWILTPH